MTAKRTCICGCGGELIGRATKYASNVCAKRVAKESRWFKIYGITPEDYQKIWREQGEACGVCRRKPRKGESFHLDHEHAEGQAGPLRGITCPYCNTRLIGRLKSAERAQQLADYLHDPPARRALGKQPWAPGRPRKKRQPRKRQR